MGFPHTVTAGTQPSAPPPPYPSQPADPKSVIDKINEFVKETGMQPFFADRLIELFPYDIVFIADDSGSMTSFSPQGGTRWDQLKLTIRMVMETALLFDSDGIDVFFLHRRGEQGYKNVTNAQQINEMFDKPLDSKANTPLLLRLDTLFKSYEDNDKPVLFVIATDGEPTDAYQGHKGIEGLTQFMDVREANEKLKAHTAMGFVMITEVMKVLKAYDVIDGKYSHVDCVSDFQAEKGQIKDPAIRAKFSTYDWVAKILLGPINQDVDELDEDKKVASKTGCCTIL